MLFNTSYINKTIKVVGYTSSALLALLLLLLALIATGMLNPFITKKLCTISNQQINGVIKIEAIKGNLFSDFSINNISISDINEPIIAIKSIYIDYSIWELLHNNLTINNLILNEASLALIESTDSLWNIQKLFPVDSSDHNSEPLLWKINLHNIIINNLEAKIFAQDSTLNIPNHVVANANAKLNFAYNKVFFNLNNLNISTQNPDFSLVNLAFQCSVVDSVLSWNNLEIALNNSKIRANGSIPLNNPEQANVNIKANPFDFADVKPWVNTLYGQANIDIALQYNNDTSILEATINQQTQALKINGILSDFKHIPKYNLAVNLDNINGEYWTHNPDFNSKLKGEITLTGQGFEIETNRLNAKAYFADLSYDTYHLSNLRASFDKEGANVLSKIKGTTIFGDIDANIMLKQIFQVPEYDILLKLKHLNLAKLTANKLLESDLNLVLNAQGNGFDPNKMTSLLHLKTEQSYIFDQAIVAMDAAMLVNKNHYKVHGLNIKTPFLVADINAFGNFNDTNNISFNFEFKKLEPLMLALQQEPFHIKGGIKGNISGAADALLFNADITLTEFEKDSIILKDIHSNITSYFTLNETLNTNTTQKNINVIPQISLENFSIKTKSQLGYIQYNNYRIEHTKLKFEKQKQNLNGALSLVSNLGKLETTFNLKNTFTIPTYSIIASVKQFNLAELMQNDSLTTAINLQVIANGTDINPDSLNLSIELKSENSDVFGYPLEDFDSKIFYNRGNYKIEQLHINTAFAEAKIEGHGNFWTENDFAFHIISKNLEGLHHSIRPANIRFKGEIKGSLKGTIDSMNVVSTIKAQHFSMDTISIENIMANGSLKKRDSLYNGSINLKLNHAKIQDLAFETLQFSSEFNQEKAFNTFSYFSTDSLNGRFVSELQFSPTPTLFFKELVLVFPQSSWQNTGENSFIAFGNDSIEINDINITSNESALSANGVFAFNGTENLDFNIKNMDLNGIPGVQLLPLPVTGILNANLNITGTSSEPKINSNIQLSEPVIDTFQFQNIEVSFAYSNDYFTMSSFVDEARSRLFYADIAFPYHLSLNEAISAPPASTPITAKFLLEQFDLARLNSFTPKMEMETKGSLTANVNLSSTISSPKVNGDITINNGSFTFKKLGVFYNNINLSSHFINNQYLVDSLIINANKGKLQLNGALEVDSLFQGELKNFNFALRGNNFQLFNSELAKVLINTTIELSGSPEKSVLNGKLSIPQSNLNVDLLMREFNRVYDNSSKPLLIEAQTLNQQLELQKKSSNDSIKKSPPDFYKNLKIHFDIDLPKNTWIKGKNMNFELAGNLKAIKENGKIDLFGTLNVKRGFYKLYGRQLEFEEGMLTFTGGSVMNPKIDFKIAYKFRDPENNLRELNVLITERLNQPTISFFIDEVAIEEKEAISYLIFNKGLNQLDNRENSSLQNSNIDLAMGQVSGLLSEVLQSKLGLDVVEIKGNSGWSQSTISTGKYLTKNVYLNYEHTFAIDKTDNVIQPQKITLEYQFYRSLFLQATNQSTNSGFDFIMKWSWK